MLDFPLSFWSDFSHSVTDKEIFKTRKLKYMIMAVQSCRIKICSENIWKKSKGISASECNFRKVTNWGRAIYKNCTPSWMFFWNVSKILWSAVWIIYKELPLYWSKCVWDLPFSRIFVKLKIDWININDWNKVPQNFENKLTGLYFS